MIHLYICLTCLTCMVIHVSKQNILYMNGFAMATVHLMGLRMATAAGAHVSTYRGAFFAKRNRSLWLDPISSMGLVYLPT